MGEVEVQWTRVKFRGQLPLDRWEAALVHPFRSLVFAWIVRRNGLWHLEIMLEDMKIRHVATYVRREKGMRQLERWIASRWKRTIPEWGVEDPRGYVGRSTWQGPKHRMLLAYNRSYGDRRF